MLSCSPVFPQYYSPPPKAQSLISGQLPSVSLLKIGCPEVYIRVHFRTRVFARQKHRCCVEPRTSLSALEVLGAYRTDCSAYFQKILDTRIVGTTITQHLSTSAPQQLDCALKNGQLFHSDNNIIIFSHQFLQTAQVVLVFLNLHTDGTLLPWADFVR